MNNSELNQLIQKVQSCDEQAFATLYTATYKGVYSFLYAIVCNRQTAEDLVQDTFIKVRTHIQQYNIGTNVMAWILQISKNLAYDLIKKSHRENEFNSESIENICGDNIDVDSNMYMHNLLINNLSQVERLIVELHLVNGLKNREISKLLKIPLGTALWRYNNSIKKLKEKIKEDTK